jgi:hypothetical protein
LNPYGVNQEKPKSFPACEKFPWEWFDLDYATTTQQLGAMNVCASCAILDTCPALDRNGRALGVVAGGIVWNSEYKARSSAAALVRVKGKRFTPEAFMYHTYSRGLTMGKIARDIDRNLNMVRTWSSGANKPSDENFALLCDYFNIHPGNFVRIPSMGHIPQTTSTLFDSVLDKVITEKDIARITHRRLATIHSWWRSANKFLTFEIQVKLYASGLFGY